MFLDVMLLRNILILAALVYFLTGAGLFFFQKKFLYYPTPDIPHPTAESLYVENDGVRIRVWKIPASEPDSDRAIIYFGGNAEPVARNVEDFARTLPGYTIYLVEYRGYGGSSGTPSEAGFYADAVAVYDAASAHHDAISVIGRSLGSGVATYLAANHEIDRLALITPYDSIEKVAAAKFPMFPVSLLLAEKYDSAVRAPKISAPTIIIVAEKDGVIPAPHSQALASQFAPEQLQLVTIAGTDHLSVSSRDEFWVRLAAFFREK